MRAADFAGAGSMEARVAALEAGAAAYATRPAPTSFYASAIGGDGAAPAAAMGDVMGVAIEGGEAVLTLRAIERPHMTSEFLLHGHQEMGAPHYHFFSMGGAGAPPVLGASAFAAAAGSGAAGGGLSLFFKGGGYICGALVAQRGCAGAIADWTVHGVDICVGIQANPYFPPCSSDCPCECGLCPPPQAAGTDSAAVSFSMNAGSLDDAQSKEGAIKTAVAGVGGVSEDSLTVAITAAARRLLATGVYKARARGPLQYAYVESCDEIHPRHITDPMAPLTSAALIAFNPASASERAGHRHHLRHGLSAHRLHQRQRVGLGPDLQRLDRRGHQLRSGLAVYQRRAPACAEGVGRQRYHRRPHRRQPRRPLPGVHRRRPLLPEAQAGCAHAAFASARAQVEPPPSCRPPA